MCMAYEKTCDLKINASKCCSMYRKAALRAEDRSEKRLKLIKTVTSEVQSLKDKLRISQEESYNLKMGLRTAGITPPLKELNKFRALSSTIKQGGGNI